MCGGTGTPWFVVFCAFCGSWVVCCLEGEWTSEPDAGVQDDAGSGEAECCGGDPVVGGCPGPVHAVGVRGQGAVQCQGGQGGEGEGQGTAGAGPQQRGGPAVEEHGHDEDGADDPSACGPQSLRPPLPQPPTSHVAD